MIVAHIAGIPVEETALSMAPVAGVLGGAALRSLRRRLRFRSGSARSVR